MSKRLSSWRAFKENVLGKTKIIKRKATAKQLEALAKAREIRTANILNKWATEAESLTPANIEFNRQAYINQLVNKAQDRNIKLAQAHFNLMHSFPIFSKEDNYKYQIFKYIDRNEFRKVIADIDNLTYTEYKSGLVRVKKGFDFEKYKNIFTYNKANESLVAIINDKTITLKFIPGKTSDEPDWVEITAK